MTAEAIMFEDVKGLGCSPMHLWIRSFEGLYNAAIEMQVSQMECSRVGQPCKTHPDLFEKTQGVKSPRARACDAKEEKKKELQKKFQDQMGVRCFFPEPQKGGNSNCGNLARRVFQNSALTAQILEIPEALVISLHKLLQSLSSSEFQDISQYQVEARRTFDLWTSVFTVHQVHDGEYTPDDRPWTSLP